MAVIWRKSLHPSRGNGTAAVLGVIALFLAFPIYAAPLDPQAAINLITGTADKICNVVSTKGEATSTEVKGQVKAELTGLAAKLADVGVSGSGSITSDQYQNVLRQDLALTLKDNANCKLRVFEKLEEKLINTTSAPPQSVAAHNISGRWHDNLGTIYQIDQQGNQFSFTAEGNWASPPVGSLCRGSFRSRGQGTIAGDIATSTYRSTSGATGNCSTTISDSRMNCIDTMCGSFSVFLSQQ